MTKKIIKWEHLTSNQEEEEHEEEEHEELYDGFLDDGNGIKIKMEDMVGHIDFTPWGPFHRLNPYGPYKRYDFWTAHMKGHSINDYYPNFPKMLDSAKGLACWKILDPYCFIIAAAKLYDIKFVQDQINKIFNIYVEDNTNKNILMKYLDKHQGQDHIGIIFPNKEIQSATFDNVDEYITIKNLVGQISGAIIIENGVVLDD